jgi:hypothetical protein
VIALGPREIGRALACALAIGGTLHILDRVIAGLARCPLEGCLLVNPPFTRNERKPRNA